VPAPDVVVLADRVPGEGGSSPWAQGGMAAAVGRHDRTVDHAADTVAAGAGLVDPGVARVIADAGPEVVAWLEGIGAAFDRDADGSLALGREAAHGANRIVHARDATGAELVRALHVAAARAPGVRIVTGQVAIDLLRADGHVVGVLTRSSETQELVAWLAPAVVLATGGYAHLWAVTTTPPQAVGDGVAMAARAGAALADLEFVQFHPTALAVGTLRAPGEPPADQVPLLTEALRGEGALLVDEGGTRFCDELAPRDVVARAIYRHLSAGHRTFLDARTLGERFPDHFPTVFGHCARVGLDPRRELIPVSPAAHYCMGGVLTDVVGRTTLGGLWAAGEVTATGLHGANRLASNSLLEGVVMGRRVGIDVRQGQRAGSAVTATGDPVVGIPPDAPTALEVDPSGVVAQVRQLLWDKVGLSRDGAGLAAAAIALDHLAREAGATCSRPARNAVLVARLVVTAASARRESRGAHLRADFPDLGAEPSPRRAVIPTAGPLVELDLGRAVAA
jgi:L-aspartate oxidase